MTDNGSVGSGDARLLDEASRFATDLTATVRAVVGGSAEPFRALAKHQGARTGLVVRQTPGEGIVMSVSGTPMLRLKVSIRCTWDHRDAYLAVDRSDFSVEATGSSEPLFRFEFLRSPASTIPGAHLQLHAHRDAITYVMTRCGTVGARAKRRARDVEAGAAVPRLSELHFPTGGSRFRPCLEDVLQMLILELGVDAEDGWQQALAEGRQQWRLYQVGASVRDSPETAARVLRELGYEVSPPGAGSLTDREERLQSY